LVLDDPISDALMDTYMMWWDSGDD